MALGYCQVFHNHAANKSTTLQGRSVGQGGGNNRSPTCKKAPALQHKAVVKRHCALKSWSIFRTAEASNETPSALPKRTEAI